VENLLLTSQGIVKLCDFGSATTTAHYPDHTWSASKRAEVVFYSSDPQLYLLGVLNLIP